MPSIRDLLNPKKLLKGRLVEPDIRTFEELSPEEQEFRRAVHAYHQGKGFPLELLRRYCGWGKGRTIKPDPRQSRTIYCTI